MNRHFHSALTVSFDTMQDGEVAKQEREVEYKKNQMLFHRKAKVKQKQKEAEELITDTSNV